MTSTVDVNIWTTLQHNPVDIRFREFSDTRGGSLYVLEIESVTIWVNAESAGRIIEALRPLVPASFGVEPEEEPEHQEMTEEEAEIYCQQEELWEKDILG